MIGYSAGDAWTKLHGVWWQATIAAIALFAAPLVILLSLFWRNAR